MNKRLPFVLFILGLLILGMAVITMATPTVAQTEPEEETQTPVDKPSNAFCLLCHNEPDQVWTLPSGEALSLTIDPEVLAGSVHGDSNPEGALDCADCHISSRFPHPPNQSRSVREFQIQRYAVCRNCHEDQYTRAQDSVHGAALRAGRIEAAICIDCHGGHDIQSPDEPRQRISLTCGKCHGAIFEEYRQSVHGADLMDESNPDVPTCTDCHGVHDIQNPTATLFRVRSPQLCAECHADEALMGQYDISTNVFDSYLTDFHGSTVALFEQQDPTVPTNKAVCYDCHGVHNIQKVTPETRVALRENLVETCRDCHPDATANFPDAWLGHYPSTPGSHPLLFVSSRVYDVLVVGVVGVSLLLILTDIIRRIRQRLTGNHKTGA